MPTSYTGTLNDERFGAIVELSRSQVAKLADALETLVEATSRAEVASEHDVTLHLISVVLQRRATVRVRRAPLDRLGKALGVDTSLSLERVAEGDR